jgi:hypothetical protein
MADDTQGTQSESGKMICVSINFTFQRLHRQYHSTSYVETSGGPWSSTEFFFTDSSTLQRRNEFSTPRPLPYSSTQCGRLWVGWFVSFPRRQEACGDVCRDGKTPERCRNGQSNILPHDRLPNLYALCTLNAVRRLDCDRIRKESS